jgi:genome maintenance exonuclease 1
MFHHEHIADFAELECVTLPTGRTYTTPDGEKLPSITTVLGALGKDWLHEWRKRVGAAEANRISREAATNGTFVHKMAEDTLNNIEVDISSLMPDKICKLNALNTAFKGIGTVYAQEIPLYSKFLGVAGRCDCVAEFDQKISIIDFKTSRHYKTEDEISGYWQQACAYAIMFEERTGIPINQLVIIMIVEGEKTPIIFKSRRDKWYPLLKESIEVYHKLKSR